MTDEENKRQRHLSKATINQYVYVQCHNRDHTRCSANGAGCVRVEMVEKSEVLDALDAKDALIAELIEFCDEGWHGQNASERFQQLKARAAQ